MYGYVNENENDYARTQAKPELALRDPRYRALRSQCPTATAVCGETSPTLPSRRNRQECLFYSLPRPSTTHCLLSTDHCPARREKPALPCPAGGIGLESETIWFVNFNFEAKGKIWYDVGHLTQAIKTSGELNVWEKY